MSYTKYEFLKNHIVKDRHLNVSITEPLNELSFGIDNLSLPLMSIKDFNLPFGSSTLAVGWNAFGAKGACSGYAITRFQRDDLTVPIYSYQQGTHTGTTQMPLGAIGQWNAFTGKGVFSMPVDERLIAPGTWLRFRTEDGMLKVTALVDVGYPQPVADNGSPFLVGRKDWFEVGLFVDDNLVSSTGPMWCRRGTVRLPVSVPIGSKNIVIDLRYRFYIAPGNEGTSPNEIERSPIVLWSSAIYARNQYR